MPTICPLCQTSSEIFFQWKKRTYHTCPNCHSIFLPQQLLPELHAEESRYREHNNDVNDPRYQKFVSPIVNAVKADFTPQHEGLDFGAGTGPVVTKLLSDAGYRLELYDPFFHPHPHLLEKTYDFIVSCEVVEHFHRPAEEFTRLKSMLKQKGKLYCMTSLYDDSIDFKQWQYKNDFTHVIIYRTETFRYIQETFGFSDLKIDKNLIILSN